MFLGANRLKSLTSECDLAKLVLPRGGFVVSDDLILLRGDLCEIMGSSAVKALSEPFDWFNSTSKSSSEDR